MQCRFPSLGRSHSRHDTGSVVRRPHSFPRAVGFGGVGVLRRVSRGADKKIAGLALFVGCLEFCFQLPLVTFLLIGRTALLVLLPPYPSHITLPAH